MSRVSGLCCPSAFPQSSTFSSSSPLRHQDRSTTSHIHKETTQLTNSHESTDIVNILSARFAEIHPEHHQLFSDLVSLLHDTFASQVGVHLDEIAFLAAKFWPRWIGFVQSGRGELFVFDVRVREEGDLTTVLCSGCEERIGFRSVSQGGSQ